MMDCHEAIFGRRSCRNFRSQPVEQEKLRRLLEAALYAPSPANKQPWEFIVTSNLKYNEQVKATSDITKEKLAVRSGWKWLPVFDLSFLLQAPTLIVVIGDPSRNGAEQFLDDPSPGYLEACSTAVQNLMLSAHVQGLGTLWFSLFEKCDVRKIFSISEVKDPIGVICVGYPAQIAKPPARKGIEDKVKFLD
jgi:nitroreductase